MSVEIEQISSAASSPYCSRAAREHQCGDTLLTSPHLTSRKSSRRCLVSSPCSPHLTKSPNDYRHFEARKMVARRARSPKCCQF